MRPSLPPGLYAITDARSGDPVAVGQQLLAAGCRLLQLRMKQATTAERTAAARRLVQAARAQGALLIVNDDLDAAAASGADGLHLGQDDGDLAAARARLGPAALIGRSTHDLDQVAAACAEGADYIGFGPVFGTATKTDTAPVVGIQGLARAVAASAVPVVAIGGIDATRLAQVRATGAHCWAVISALETARREGDRALRQAVAGLR